MHVLVGTDRIGVEFLCPGGFLVGLTFIHKCGFPGTGRNNHHICDLLRETRRSARKILKCNLLALKSL